MVGGDFDNLTATINIVQLLTRRKIVHLHPSRDSLGRLAVIAPHIRIELLKTGAVLLET